MTLYVQVGDAKECTPGPRVADAAGKETALPAATRLLPTLPHHGDQPQGKRDGSLWVLAPLGKCVHIVRTVSDWSAECGHVCNPRTCDAGTGGLLQA